MALEINLRRLKTYAPLVLRIGMAAVFLYFGITQLMRPEAFVGWLPPEANLIPLPATTLVALNGGFETLFGTLLLLGLFRRISALLLGMHLMMITITIGLTDIGVRDFGLAVAAISIALTETDNLSLDTFFSDRESDMVI